MKLRSRSLLAAAVALASNGALSADTYLNVFFDSAPMQGINVKFDGQDLGMTDERGSVSTYTPAGAHTIELYRAGVLLTSVQYEVDADEDAEISVTFPEDDDSPEITVNKFDSDDAQATGYVGGIITDRDGLPIAGASVVEANSGREAMTSADGSYELELPRGQYSFDVSHPDYSGATIRDIRVLADLGVVASLQLSPRPSGVGISVAAPIIQGPVEEVLTVGTYKPSDSSLGLERFSTNVVDALDIEQMARFGDSNVAVALTRLVGVTVTGGKYANVRGLDGRYISSTLNGFLMPSTDPMRRDVQLDLFPAGILDSIEVQKTYSPDLLGTTTGGALKITTKGLPDERTAKMSLKLGSNSEYIGKEIITYEGSNGDWLGFDSGLRDLPQNVVDATDGGTSLTVGCSFDFCVDPLTAAQYGVEFQDDYNVGTKKSNPEVEMALSFGDITDSGLFGYYGALKYSYGTDVRMDAQLSNPFEVDGEYNRSQENYSLDGYFVFGSNFRAEDEILSRTMLLRDSDNTTRVDSGFDNGEDIYIDKVILEWVERQFFSQQVTGKHVFDIGADAHQLDWRIAYSNTNRYEPDRRQYAYYSGTLSSSSFERRWSDLDEDSIDYGFDYVAPVEFTSWWTTEFAVGALVSEKSREVELYRFGIQPMPGSDLDLSVDANLEETLAYYNFALDKVRIDPNTTSTDSYNADENVTAGYLNTTTDLGDSWTVMLGVRQEDFEQILEYPNSPESNNSLESSEALPAFSLTFAPGESWQFRAGASKTVSYPGIIERSQSSTFDPETDRPIFGNPNLVYSTIDNLDFRVEYYFSDEESVSLALFNKEIENPVEQALPPGSGSAAKGITYRNSEAATLNGIELDASVNMFETGSWLGFISGNVAYIESEVTLDEMSLALEGEAQQGRELQGQSPWLANLQLGFDHYPLEQKFTLLVNYYDDRIYRVQRAARTGPEYEVGRTEINFNYEKMFSETMTLQVQAKNLLDSEVEYRIGDRITESYKKGIEVSAKVSWEF